MKLALLSATDFTGSKYDINVYLKNIMTISFNEGNFGYNCYDNSDDAFNEVFSCSAYITNKIHNIIYKKIKQFGFWIRVINYCIIGHLILAVILLVLHLIIKDKKIEIFISVNFYNF